MIQNFYISISRHTQQHSKLVNWTTKMTTSANLVYTPFVLERIFSTDIPMRARYRNLMLWNFSTVSTMLVLYFCDAMINVLHSELRYACKLDTFTENESRIFFSQNTIANTLATYWPKIDGYLISCISLISNAHPDTHTYTRSKHSCYLTSVYCSFTESNLKQREATV